MNENWLPFRWQIVALVLAMSGALGWVQPALAHSGEPGQGSLWWAWQPAPWPWLLWWGAALSYGRGVVVVWQRAGWGRSLRRWQVAAYAAGMGTLAAALLSPLDHLAHEAFAFHMVQHMLLIMVAAPLLALGAPHLAYLWALPRSLRREMARRYRQTSWWRAGWSALRHPATVWLLHTAALWLWHIPGFYVAALEKPWLHGLEHFSFLSTAILFWWLLGQVSVRQSMGYGTTLLYIFTTMIQGTVLGALLTFAPTAWYPMQTLAGGVLGHLTPLQDQQLAGVVMWVPGAPIYLAAFLWFTAQWLRASDRAAARAQPVWMQLQQPTLEGD